MSCCCQTSPILRIISPDLRFGPSVEFKRNLYNTITEYDCPCVQMMMCESRRIAITPEDKQKTLQHCQKHNLTFYWHCPLTANLAKREDIASLKEVAEQITLINGLPGACVLHVGKVGRFGQAGSIEILADNINAMINNNILLNSNTKIPYHLLLENAAGQKNELGVSWEEMRHIYEAIDKTRVGLCVDTQHLFAAGGNNFENHESVVKLFDETDALAKNGIAAVHLNDSCKTFGSHVDRHEVLGQGHIWYREKEGLQSLIRICNSRAIDMLSETGGSPELEGKLVRECVNI